MTRYTRVRLAPRGPFHFGGRGVGMEHSDVGLGADSLFSALCVVLAESGTPGQPADLLAHFAEAKTPAQLPFRLTSLMPCAGEVYFLPHPEVGPPCVPGATDLEKRKLFKGVEWVSESVFGALARGEFPAGAVDGKNRPVTIHGGQVWLTAAERAALAGFEARHPDTHAVQRPVLWRAGPRPRVTVDRRTSASTVYAAGATVFNRAGDESAGLYTVIEWLAADEGTRATIRRTFEQLGAAGIGGERSSGHGHFEPAFEELARWSPGALAGDYFTTLSPYHPRSSEREVLGEGARYEIALRRGWLGLQGYQNLRRASVRMIAEGSVLCRPSQGEPFGDLADVTPDALGAGHRIYRYGLAFPVPVTRDAMKGGAA